MAFFPADYRTNSLNIRDNAKVLFEQKKKNDIQYLKEYHYRMYIKSIQLDEDFAAARRPAVSPVVRLALAHDNLADMVNSGTHLSVKPRDNKNFRKRVEDFIDAKHDYFASVRKGRELSPDEIRRYVGGIHRDVQIPSSFVSAFNKLLSQSDTRELEGEMSRQKENFLEHLYSHKPEEHGKIIKQLLSGGRPLGSKESFMQPSHPGEYIGFMTFSDMPRGRPTEWLHPEIQDYHDTNSTEEIDPDILKTVGSLMGTTRTSGGNIIDDYIPTTRDLAAHNRMFFSVDPQDFVKSARRAYQTNETKPWETYEVKIPGVSDVFGSRRIDQNMLADPLKWPTPYVRYAENNPKSDIGGYYRDFMQYHPSWTPEGWHESHQDPMFMEQPAKEPVREIETPRMAQAEPQVSRQQDFEPIQVQTTNPSQPRRLMDFINSMIGRIRQ